MGVNDRVQNKKDDALRTKQAKRRLGDSSVRGGQVADLETLNGQLVLKLAGALAKLGGALRLGYTRDGGAYAFGIYGLEEPYTVYVSPSEDLDEWFSSAITELETG